MKQESSTKTPDKKGNIGGETKVESCGLILYQWDSKRGPRYLIYKSNFYLKGERIISAVNVLTPNNEVPILATMTKKIDNKNNEMNINVQDIRSNIFTRFQIGETFSGYLENQ